MPVREKKTQWLLWFKDSARTGSISECPGRLKEFHVQGEDADLILAHEPAAGASAMCWLPR